MALPFASCIVSRIACGIFPPCVELGSAPLASVGVGAGPPLPAPFHLVWRHTVIDWSWPEATLARAATPIYLNQISSDSTGGIAPVNLTSVGNPRINADDNGHFFLKIHLQIHFIILILIVHF